MRNFTGNPFLMVSERSGHAKLVKTSKNKFFGEITDILEVVESRSTRYPTVVESRVTHTPLRRSAVDKDCRVPERIFPRDVGRCLVNEFLIGNRHPWRESCYLLSIHFKQIRWRGWPAARRIFFWILTFGIHKLLKKKRISKHENHKKNPPAVGCQ